MAGPTLSPLMISTFDRVLHRTPQEGSILKDTVRVESGIMAADHSFPALGRALARTRAALQPIQASPTIKRRPKVTLKVAEHYEFLDQYEAARTNVNAMAGYAMNSRQAVERACDQWILDALDSPNAQAIGASITAVTSTPDNKVTVAHVAKAMTALLVRGVGRGDMLSFVYSDAHFENITAINQLISRDYSERGLIGTGKIPPIFGMMWKGIEWRAEGGGSILATGDVDSNDRGGLVDTKGYLVAKNGTALALGTVNNMRDISWRNDLGAWQIGAKLLGNATVVDRSMLCPITLEL